ncbi:hypothetical protein SAMN02745166_03546 [Prosthecobacter debontii]|uniref:Uncharacterized protein n=1 Tax=Prosthecobacter debontii TaxID=48467 RepID=A0A1T4YLG3_9BACT|nr:hypothetical protein [Prosthecobacter debontii]SKB02111.1 hypothetical protein SAMN02745166_03546 [Prosthecobacter debontii]
MTIFQRVLSFFGGRSQPEPKGQFDDATAEELLSTAERLMLDSVRSYKPQRADRSSRFAQAEYAPFMFFWVQHWHDQQPEPIRGYDVLLKLLISKAQDGALAIRSYHSLNFNRGWDPDLWFDDRLRIYRSIIAAESQKTAGTGPPSIFKACYMLATLSARSNSLEILPSVKSSGDLLDLCLSQHIFPDALEQFDLYSHATASLGTTIPLLVEVVSEIHLRRLANLHSKK